MKDYDPPKHERKYYRHGTTGDLGWLVLRDGKDWIRLDRGEGADEHLRPFRRLDWIEEHEHREMSQAHIARVAFEADKALCMALGMHERGQLDWMKLSDEARIKWVDRGPPMSHALRRRLYDSVRFALGET